MLLMKCDLVISRMKIDRKHVETDWWVYYRCGSFGDEQPTLNLRVSHKLLYQRPDLPERRGRNSSTSVTDP